MTLSPQDVRNKLFTPVRFKPGYDEDEVDAFLDEVEAELTRLGGEIDQLRAGAGPEAEPTEDQLAAVRAQARAEAEAQAEARVQAAVAAAEQRNAAQLAAVRAEAESQLEALRTELAAPVWPDAVDADPQPVSAWREAATPDADPEVARLTEQLEQVRSQLQQTHGQLQLATQQASAAGTEVERLRAEATASPALAVTGGVTEETLRRTLVLAQRTADEAVFEAREEAASIRATAQAEAEETTRMAAAEHAVISRRREADHAAAIARGRAEHDLLVSKLEELRSFERDYRSRLRAYLHLQLRDLEAGAPEPTAAVTGRRTPALGAADEAAPEGPTADGSDAPPAPVEPAEASPDTTDTTDAAGPTSVAVGDTEPEGAAPTTTAFGVADPPQGPVHGDGDWLDAPSGR